MQLAEHACFFQHRRLTGNRIVGAVYPGVVMIAANDPLVDRRSRASVPITS